jgi:hypothetical protein
MQVISTNARIFFRPSTKEKVTVHKTAVGATATVPDWVAQDPYFDMCVNDGSLTVVKDRIAEAATGPASFRRSTPNE